MQPGTYLPMWNFILSYSHWWFWLSLRTSNYITPPQQQEWVRSPPSWSVLEPLQDYPSPPAAWLCMKAVSAGCPQFKGLPLAVACSSRYSFFISSHPQFLAFLTAQYLLPWYPRSVFLLWHSTFSESDVSGETLDLAQKPLHFLQVGPARYVPETELDNLVFVHTLGSGLWVHFQQACCLSSTVEMSEALTVMTGISLTISKKINYNSNESINYNSNESIKTHLFVNTQLLGYISLFCIKLEPVALFTEKALLCQANWQRGCSCNKRTTS